MSPLWHVSSRSGVRVRFEPERTGTPFLFFFWSPEHRSGPFRHIAAKFRFHLNESDKFALFGSKMPSASGGFAPPDPDQGLCPWTPLGAPPRDPHIGSRSRARHILSVPVLFLTGNEPWAVWQPCELLYTCYLLTYLLTPVLRHCWLGVRNSIRPEKNKWPGVGAVIYLERGVDCLRKVQLMPLHPKTPSSLASFKFRLVFPFCYLLTQVVVENRPLKECRVVVVEVAVV